MFNMGLEMRVKMFVKLVFYLFYFIMIVNLFFNIEK